ncbi:hypothetical protein D4764_15G0006660 [Takifugu flavidus]|uniref:Uncharacterized protein n=1 Tax=Takifugu flavidus TaxID=433684 RepID=A0A5C6P0D7_9TELE|nr:hypothetical protein D4764_15G0006660 [Takifugu flavidus]
MGPRRYICWPAGLSTRHSPGHWDGEIKGWIGSTLPRRDTSTKSLSDLLNSPLSWYIASELADMKGRWASGPRQRRAAEGFPTIRCNPANAGVGWPYPAKAAVHRKNALCMPG